MAGVFFAFSTFVIAALARIAPEQGMAAMRSINVTVLNPALMMALFGTALMCVVLAASSYYRWHEPGHLLVLLASLIYVVGCIGVTIAGNVPLNDALAAVEPGTPAAQTFWARFLADWLMWKSRAHGSFARGRNAFHLCPHPAAGTVKRRQDPLRTRPSVCNSVRARTSSHTRRETVLEFDPGRVERSCV